MSLHNEFGWGDPYDELDKMFGGDRETIIKMIDSGMLGYNGEQFGTDNLGSEWQRAAGYREYIAIPKIDFSESNCENYTEIIEACENDKPLPGKIFDLLGEYRLKEKDAYDQQGEIIIYNRCIRQVGKKIYKETSFGSEVTEDTIINYLYDIVLWHELGHWVTHWMTDSNLHRWNNQPKLFDEANTELLEGLAQCFTYYAMNHLKDDKEKECYMKVFESLLKDQPDCYHKHKEIIQCKVFTWKGLMKGIENLRTENDINKVSLEDLKKTISKYWQI